jgi:hypothetical protein
LVSKLFHNVAQPPSAVKKRGCELLAVVRRVDPAAKHFGNEYFGEDQ